MFKIVVVEKHFFVNRFCNCLKIKVLYVKISVNNYDDRS